MNFKKVLVGFFLSLAVSLPSIANTDIKIVIPFSEGGGTATMSKLVVEYLENNGYNVNLHIAGNPANARRIYENTDTPSIVVWENGYLANEGSVGDIGPPTPKNFFNVWFWAPFYVCSKPGYDDILNVDANVGVNPHPSFPNWYLDALLSVNPKLNPVTYVNSGAIKTALVSGEIDIAISDRGLEWDNDKIVNCIYNTSEEVLNDLTPLSEKLEKNVGYSFIAYSFVVNMNNDLKTALQQDFKDALRSKKVTDYFDSRGQDQRIMQGSPAEQLDFVYSTL